jgi:hypothetical protein
MKHVEGEWELSLHAGEITEVVADEEIAYINMSTMNPFKFKS